MSSILKIEKLLRVYSIDELLPVEWRSLGKPDCYVFNPSIAAFGDGILMAYRVVLHDQRRRIAICRLNDSLEVIPSSVVPFSDSLTDAGDWHADPRFCVFRGRLLLHFNNGPECPNKIYLVELSPDILRALGPARPLLLEGRRRTVEKNWMLFEHEGQLLSVYSTAPHVIHRVEFKDQGPIHCELVHEASWDTRAYTELYGEIRGGAPPVRVGREYYAFGHSAYYLPLIQRIGRSLIYGRGRHIQRYECSLYSFTAAPPFSPIRFSRFPVFLPPGLSQLHQERLNKAIDYCVYPTGAIFRDGRWFVSFGFQDEYCCVAELQHENLLAMMEPARLTS